MKLTDASSGFTLAKGNFSITFPDGSTRIKTDFTSPDISTPSANISIPAVLDNNNNVITGTYKIDFIALDASNTSYSSSKTFDFNWVKPTNLITDLSDVITPQVQFKDNASYSPIGSFTGTVSRVFSVPFPTTSEASAQPATSTTSNTLTPVYSGNYYEGVYNVSNDVSCNYTHTTNSWLTINYVELFTKSIAIKKCPNQLGLIAKMNTYRAVIEAYKEKNDTQFNILSEQYDLAIALYSHIIARYETSTQDGSEGQLRELLSILEPYTGSYTYQLTKMLPFELALTTSNSFTISDGTNTDSVQLGGTLTFSGSSNALKPSVTDNQINFTPVFGTDANTFAQGNDSRFHNAVTIATANGLSLASQALSLATATSSSSGAMSAADKAKLDGIAAGANVGTVTSIGISVPSAFTVSNSPITSSGVINISATGNPLQYITGAGALATLNTGVVPESGNLYFTNTRARTAISVSGSLSYNSTTGVISYTTPSETDPIFIASPSYGITNTNISNWNTAYGWGNHALAGYLTSFTETDPIYVASSWYTTTNNSSNWDTAYGWGNHASAGYLTIVSAASSYQPLDADLTAIAVITATSGLLKKTAANTWSLDTNTYLTSFTETDPIYVASSWYSTTNNSSNWNTAYGWGNHALAGYLTSINSSQITTALGFTPENAANKGIANGYASLDGAGLVPSTQLPSYVDDVLEYTNLAGFPATGATGKIYVALDTNKIYRWSGSTYIEVSPTVGTIWGGITGTLANQTDLQSALDAKQDDITLTTTGTSGAATFIGNTLNIPQYQGGVTSFNTRTGAITLTSSDVTTALTFTPYNATNPNAYIALTALSAGTGISYNNTTGVITNTITQYTDALARAAISATGNISYNSTTGVISTSLTQYTDALARAAISLTTTGTSGAATYNSTTGVLNIPSYQGGVTSFNTRTGAITLTSGDVTTALTYTPYPTPTGDTTQYVAGDGSLISFPVAGQSGTLVRQVRNTTGATLTKGTVVYISGASGNKPTVSKAIATADSTSAQTFGLVQADISNNSNGYVVCVGDIAGLNTSAFEEGVQLYLSSTTAGTYTSTKQYAPNHLVYIGVVTRSHPTQGEIEVKIQNGYELDELHDVAAQTPSNNDGLFYESSTNLWKNKSITTVLGYTPYNATNPNNYIALTALSSTATGLTYTNTTGVFSLTSGYVIPTTTEQSNWNTAYGWGNHASAGYLTTSSAASTYQPLDADLTAIAGLAGTSGLLKKTAADTWSLDTNTYLTSITSSNVTTALGYTPVTNARTLTINGTAYDLSADRSWTVSGSQWTTSGSNIYYNTGNVGIGASSPSYKLHITGTSGTGARLLQLDGTGTAYNILSVINDGSQVFLAAEGSTAGTIATGSIAYAGVLDTNTNTALQFATYATVRMTIANTGNVGINSIPSAWGSGQTALQIGSRAAFANGASGQTLVGNNYYSNGTNNIYLQTAAASIYEQSGGAHYWYYAPSGTSGANITFVAGMTLNNSGRVGIGTTSPVAPLSVSASASSSYPTLYLTQGTSPYGQISGVDAAHGIIMRGYPANGSITDYSATAADVTSFYEYGGEFRFYKKNGTLTEQAKIASDGTFSAVSFSGAGTGLTGTASSLSIGGSAGSLGGVTTSQIVYGDNSTKTASFSNANDALSSGFYNAYGAGNMPYTSWFNLITCRHSNPANNFQMQIAAEFWDANYWLRKVTGSSGSTTSWARIVQSVSDPYAAAMDQYVRTSDTVQFGSIRTGGSFTGYHASFKPTTNVTLNVGFSSGNIGVNGPFLNATRNGISDTTSVPMFFNGDTFNWFCNYDQKMKLEAQYGDLFLRGYIYQGNTNWSDLRMKQNLKQITDPLTKIKAINGYTFEWREWTGYRNTPELVERINDAGLIAQEVEAILPEIVETDTRRDQKSMNYNGVIALHTEGIKKLIEENEALLKRVEELESKLL